MKIRAKPLILEAWQVPHDLHESRRDQPPWISEAIAANILQIVGLMGRIYIKTPDGTRSAEADDWIVRGLAGELYPVRKEMFRLAYEIEP